MLKKTFHCNLLRYIRGGIFKFQNCTLNNLNFLKLIKKNKKETGNIFASLKTMLRLYIFKIKKCMFKDNFILIVFRKKRDNFLQKNNSHSSCIFLIKKDHFPCLCFCFCFCFICIPLQSFVLLLPLPWFLPGT